MIKEQLNYLINLVNDVKNSNSSNEKRVILNKHYQINEELFKKFMDYIYSYDKKYWMTSENILKLWEKFEKKYKFNDEQSIFDVLDQLNNRIITGHDAINYVIDLIKYLNDDKYKEIIFCVVNKDLKANINVSQINKVVKCVKEFKVALAEKTTDAPIIHQINLEKENNWMVSRKLDGVRTLSINNNGEIEQYSRTGTLFSTLDNLKPQVKLILDKAKQLYGEEFVLDGETCLLKADGHDDFSGIMKEITRKNHTILNPKYIVFDLIKKSEFENANGTTHFAQRIKMLEDLHVESFGDYVKLVDHQNNVDVVSFKKWKERVNEEGWEGLMLRDMNSLYNGKRTYDLQKVKAFDDAEYEVVGIETGTKKMLNAQGLMEEQQCVKSLIIEHKGFKMNVGSGLSDEQRVLWYKNPELIIKKIITVQYFEETIDSKTGNPSLRFPTLKTVYEGKREI